MRHLRVVVLMSFLLSAAAIAQQPPAGAAPAAMQAATQEVYQVDLNPTGSGFALGKPVLEGEVYVLKVWPDGDVVRLPKSRIKKIAPRTKDIQKQVVYRIDLAPTGQMYSRDEPQ